MNRCCLGIAPIVLLLIAIMPVQAATPTTIPAQPSHPNPSNSDAAPSSWTDALSDFSSISSQSNDAFTGLTLAHRLEVDASTTHLSAKGSTASKGSSDVGSSTTSAVNLDTNTYYIVENNLLYKHDATGFTYVVGPPARFMQPNVNYFANKTSFYIKQGKQFVFVGKFENPYRTLDLRTATSLSAQDIAAFINANDAMSPLKSLAPVYLQAQQQFGVNAAYLVAHSIIESTWGSSQIAHDKNNLFGYSAYDSSPYSSAATFPSKAYAILYEAWFVRKYYLDSSGTYFHGANLDGMNVDYATDPNWTEKIAAVMWNMDPLSTSAASTSILPEATSEPVFSYPPGVLGQVTTNGLHVRSGPGLAFSIIDSWNSGQLAQIVGWVPGWYQVNTKSNGVAYVSSQYIHVTNLGVIRGDSVNLRAGPSTLSPIMDRLQYATEVELLGLSQDKQWSYVHTVQNVTGYVYSAYVQALQ